MTKDIPSSSSPYSSSSSSSSPTSLKNGRTIDSQSIMNKNNNGNHQSAAAAAAAMSSQEQKQQQQQRQQRIEGARKTRKILSVFGSLISFSVHGILFGLFLAWATVYCIRTLYDEYFVTIIDRARRTDDDLLLEYTYYTRECSLIDLTADLTTAHQLVVDPRDDDGDDDGVDKSKNGHSRNKKKARRAAPADRAVDSVMLHGAVMIPALLKDSTIDKLRAFVVRKNKAVVGTSAEYPVSQGRNRISYGIEATEDEAVIEALKELHDHTMLRDVVSKLVGPNPALSEITAITASYGAGPQAWHSDTKADGNAVLYSRTYEHSYSIFIPLQDTTAEMGPTDLCPGTHYCADDNLEYLCEQHKIGLHQIRRHAPSSQTQRYHQPGFMSLKHCHDCDDGTYQNFGRNDSQAIKQLHDENEDDYDDHDGVWRRGDAVLLNQQVWHRGSGHTAEGSPERIVFILSFLGRPTSDDPRQLARGTYFHMKWNMWGHTWQDMADSARSMARPWSILRCLHLWKPRDRDWGYDLFTSATLRIANQQLGCAPGDLDTFVSEVMVPLGTPEFLHGTIDTDHDEAWMIYLKETITNFWVFLQKLNVAGFLVALVLLLLAASFAHYQGGSAVSVISNGILRLVLTHSLVVALAVFTLHSVHSSKWAKDIASGKTLMRPFPTEVWSLDDPTVSDGKTVVPQRFDVLVGSRFNSPHIGKYSDWLEYHYGNRLFDDFVSAHGGRSFRSLPSNLGRLVIQAGIDLVQQRSGHFLQQDYLSGSWRLLNLLEVESFVNLQLSVGRSTLFDALLQEVDFLYDQNRFGVPSRKRVPMSWLAQRQLDDLGQSIFSVWLMKNGKSFGRRSDHSQIDATTSSFRFRSSFQPQLPHYRTSREKPTNTEALRLFDEVEYRLPNSSKRVFVGTVVGVNPLGGYNVAFYSGSVRWMNPVEYGIPSHMLRKRRPVVEGATVLGDFYGQGELFPGKVLAAWPDGSVDILYDDNDTELVYPGMYFITG